MNTPQASRWLLAAFLLVAIPACAPSRASNSRLFSQWNAKCKEAADLLETVKDVASAKAASPKIATVMRELHKIDEQLQQSYDSEDVDAIEAPRVTRQVGEGIAHMQRLMAESLRVGKDPEMQAAMGEAWNLLPVAGMMEAGVEFPTVE